MVYYAIVIVTKISVLISPFRITIRLCNETKAVEVSARSSLICSRKSPYTTKTRIRMSTSILRYNSRR